jgi:hypothetical protein
MDSLSTPTAGSSGIQNPISDSEYNTQLGRLAERWRSQREADLELRYETGALLNKRFGDPTTRQNRGAGILKEAAQQLEIDKSDLSRMRAFAFAFESLADFKEKHPEAKSWTAVKKLLPTLQSQDEATEQGTDGVATPPTARKQIAPKPDVVVRSLMDLSSKLSHAQMSMTAVERTVLLGSLKEFAKAVECCLQIQVSVQ